MNHKFDSKPREGKNRRLMECWKFPIKHVNQTLRQLKIIICTAGSRAGCLTRNGHEDYTK